MTNSKIGLSDDLSVWDKLSHSFAYGLNAEANSIICFKGGSGRKARAAWRNIQHALRLGSNLDSLFSLHSGIPLR